VHTYCNRATRLLTLLLVAALTHAVMGYRTDSQEAAIPPYKNPALPLADRVNDLVSRMTLEEKVSQLMNGTAAVGRLDVPAYDWWNEGLHGVARAGLATVFPQAIGLAATWDTALMRQIASAISDEARAKHHDFARRGKRGLYQGLTFWSPNINIFRDPRWGRGMETYGEDPYLVGRLAVEFVKGLQGDDPRYLKTVATPKHYAVHSGPEPDRHAFNAVTDERDLRDTYLAQFEAAVREGGAMSVMCAYNRYMGEACCSSPRLLGDILRKEWGFNGYVVSDCGAIDDIYKTHKLVPTAAAAAAMSVKAGCDLNCGDTYKALVTAVKDGLVTEREIDEAVRRLFTVRFRLGMFDPPDTVPYSRIPYGVVDSPEHRDLALRAARESIVLLKNDRDTLPLRSNLKTIAVIGPNADDVEALLGNYNGTPSNPVTPLEGIRRKAGSATRVLYAQGADWADKMPALEVVPSSALWTARDGQRVNGLTGEYFNNRGLLGQPEFTRVDTQVDFHWWEKTPDPRITEDDNFGVRWTGELVPPVSGDYTIGGYGLTSFRVFLDGRLLVEFRSSHEASKVTKNVPLEAGRACRIRIEYYDRGSDARMQLLWRVPGRDLEREAINAASEADAVVLVMGLSPRLEGEEMEVPVKGFKGGDRVSLDLPKIQQRLLEKVQGLGKPVVLLLLNGSALGCTWAAEHVPAIVEAWYPGQAAGDAIADVLFGDYNPAGRLPVTFYESAGQLPKFTDYRMAGRTYRYFAGKPLYPFGHGLSYTRFAYGNLSVPKTVENGEAIAVSVEVENVGARAGDEVVQLYVTDVRATVPVPIRALQGVQRISLQPGERRAVSFTLAPRQLSLLDRSLQRIVEPGVFEVAVGGKQPGFRGGADAATTTVMSARFEVIGEALRVQ
jgi:beta-glucosidase